MADVYQGKLTWTQGKGGLRPLVKGPAKKGGTQDYRPAPGMLSIELTLIQAGETDVDFEIDQGKAVRVRSRGGTWSAGQTVVLPSRPVPGPRTAPRTAAETRPAAIRISGGRGQSDYFNPYNFVPAPNPVMTGPLAQGAPAGHDRLHPELYSGRIRLGIEVITPLLLPDVSKRTVDASNKHQTFPLLIDAEGKPSIRPTSFKGALRAAYEAVTNSRLSTFYDHRSRLGRRMDAGEGLAMVPARIADDGKTVEYYFGESATAPWDEAVPKWNGRYWKAHNDTMYAAWIRRYERARRSDTRSSSARSAPRLEQVAAAQEHKMPVAVLLQRIEKYNLDKKTRERSRNPAFSYWSVRAIVSPDKIATLPKGRDRATLGARETDKHVPTNDFIEGVGYFCVTGHNIANKHDERVFFTPPDVKPRTGPLKHEWKVQWKALIADYLAKAEVARKTRNGASDRDFLGTEPGKTAFSRHVWDETMWDLRPGTLCYARIDTRGQVSGLYPVMIARELAEAPPEEFLPNTLQPAATLDDLSPADRVFGWVRQNEGDGEAGPGGAWRGQLRIRSIVCLSSVDEAKESFREPGLPLAILSAPKPEQARFYLGDRVGASQGDGLTKLEAAYCRPDAKRLRGRKVYPHHAGLPDDYWNGQEAFWKLVDKLGEAQSIGDRFREYLRVTDDPERSLQDEQNRSILGWVKPGARFEADIEVTNLREAELGALLWLASLPDGYLRLGGGKPLGFGSVRLSIRTVDLYDGVAAADRWRRLAVGTGGRGAGRRLQEPAAPIAAFRSAIAVAYGGDFDRVPFIAAYRAAAVGHVGPVHYPRVGTSEPGLGIRPSGKGENFKWFVANERSDAPECLPDLATQRGLRALEDTKPVN
jgi:CRISPR-associated protein (TIGR03986 family)